MPIVREQYSRSQRLDVKQAMATAIANYLRSLRFPRASGGEFAFAQVFEEWPDYEQRFVPPSACVLPTPTLYAPARLTPTLMEDTWEIRGEPGFGLYKLADIEADFEINVRAPSGAERSDIIAGIEQAWVAADLLMDHSSGARYGIELAMPEYWGLCATFALLSARVLDNEDMAMKAHREAVLTLSGVAPQVKLGPVRPMNMNIRLRVNEGAC
jgi:hypothetical protein